VLRARSSALGRQPVADERHRRGVIFGVDLGLANGGGLVGGGRIDGTAGEAERRRQAAPWARVGLVPSPEGPGPFIAEVRISMSGSALGMRGFRGGWAGWGGPCARIWSGPVTWSRPGACEVSLTAWWPGRSAAHLGRPTWGGPPDEMAGGGRVPDHHAARQPGTARCHVHPRATSEDQPLRRGAWCAALRVARRRRWAVPAVRQPGVRQRHGCTAECGEKSRISAPGRQCPASRREEGGTLSMWVFLSARLRMWLLLVIAVPVARLLVHRLAVAAERHDPSARTAKLLRRADSAVTAVSGRFSRRARR
jgi:hypothetical protein